MSICHEKEYYNKSQSISEWVDDWDFKGAESKTYTHRIHKYPAIFIPQLVRKIILEYSEEGDSVLDIFSGSGTSHIECSLLGRDSIGIELNPLAVLISKVKTTIVKHEDLIDAFKVIEKMYHDDDFIYDNIVFPNIDYWYSSEMQNSISKLIATIRTIRSQDIKDFLLISLSDILRKVSFCKHSGFKMHRDVKKIEKKIDQMGLFRLFSERFLQNAESHNAYCSKFKTMKQPRVSIINGSSIESQKTIKKESIDLIVTSPPYGDSRTTVAYGQFSRLSSQWFELDNDYERGAVANLDNDLLGGKTKNISLDESVIQKSTTLSSAIELFKYRLSNYTDKDQAKKMEKRIKDVISFYKDLDLALCTNSKYLKPSKHFVLVTASRVVKEVKLHTDIIISEFAEHYGLRLSAIFYRNILNKRMPSYVSATNVKGERTPTMTKESIVVLKKK